MTPEPLIRFTEKWYDRIVDQPLSAKIFDTLVHDFKLAITRRLSQNPPSKSFNTMNPQDKARFLRRHPALLNQSLSTVTQPLAPNFPAFRKWNPVERAKYLRHQRTLKAKEPSPSNPRPTPRYPPGISRTLS